MLYEVITPLTSAVIDMFSTKHVWNKDVFRLGSYAWTGGAQKDFEKKIESLKWNCIEPLEWMGVPTEEDHDKAFEQGKKLAIRVKES